MAKLCRCGSIAVEKQVDIERNIGGRRIIFKKVPAFICPNCSERYFTSKTIKHMDRLLAKKGNKTEIDFELDPKEQQFLSYFKIFKDRFICPRGATMDMPVSLADLFLVASRLSELKLEQSYK
ncbi:MAG: YgiT-type zinc finger protein [Pelotomaculum sp.]|uniref:YgiT-type zinc finger protein n=1 Tax=Pelotomaculum thermopropionicum (strain DSM 13744 / JCM 10971 / SI) TaxID=370438 RepID=A5D577_PELTS|nr:YgiT-type zinc finger protein [Pelotomaculum sp.]BAF58604.1 hypothetical protein PTH_0423 [Pelotomaculum thermopropionicum SI]